MLQITVIIVPERYDEGADSFLPPETVTLDLEHSLISVSKWESKWNKSFLSNDGLSDEETFDYIKCMTLTPNVDPTVYECLNNENIKQIKEYIEAPMTATTFSEDRTGKKNREKITSELIYYWMIALQIPVEFENWHLNRLLTLIRVCNIKNQPPKKTSRSDIMSRNAALNAQRRAQLNSKG